MEVVKVSDVLPEWTGKEAWVFGKGRSLDGVKWKKVGKLRVAINHAALVVPKCSVMFSNHDWLSMIGTSNPAKIYASPSVPAGEFNIQPCAVVPPETLPGRWAQFRQLYLSEGDLIDFWKTYPWIENNTLLDRGGSPVPAVHALCLARVSVIHLIGFDGGWRLAKPFRHMERIHPVGMPLSSTQINSLTMEFINLLARCHSIEIINHSKHEPSLH